MREWENVHICVNDWSHRWSASCPPETTNQKEEVENIELWLCHVTRAKLTFFEHQKIYILSLNTMTIKHNQNQMFAHLLSDNWKSIFSALKYFNWTFSQSKLVQRSTPLGDWKFHCWRARFMSSTSFSIRMEICVHVLTSNEIKMREHIF